MLDFQYLMSFQICDQLVLLQSIFFKLEEICYSAYLSYFYFCRYLCILLVFVILTLIAGCEWAERDLSEPFVANMAY